MPTQSTSERALKAQQPRPKCANCNKPGHQKDDCWAKGGGKEGQIPAWYQAKDREKREQKTAKANVVSTGSTNVDSPPSSDAANLAEYVVQEHAGDGGTK